MKMNKIKSQDQIDKERYDHIMETIAWRAGYYRANPHRFVKDVLGIDLKLFQKILLYAMMHNHYFMLIGSRGIGKSFLTSLFCCVRCILYPNSMIVVASGSLKQAREFVVKKIQNELMNMSPILCSEIDVKNIKTGQNEIFVPFKNGSYITATTSNQNARGQRSNVLIIDEFRMVDLEVLNQVLRKFNASPRQPRYLNKPEYKHLKERNIEMYLSSAYLKSSWAYKKAQAYTKNFFRDNKKYFICGLPYQLAIREGIYMREQAEDEMSEADFNEMDWEMEMETKWLGATDGALFQFDDINACRRIQNGFTPLKFYSDKNPVPKLMQAEKRILSVDVALMATNKKKKNDATAIFINNLIQTNDTKYQSNIVYGETFEGLTTDELGIIIMRYFYQYKCTDLVLDCAGVGLSVYDFIIKNQYDPQYGITYQALTSINSPDMAERCKVHDANKVVWCIKANASFNSEIAILLRIC